MTHMVTGIALMSKSHCTHACLRVLLIFQLVLLIFQLWFSTTSISIKHPFQRKEGHLSHVLQPQLSKSHLWSHEMSDFI